MGLRKKTTGNSGSTLLRFSLKIPCSSSFSHNVHMKKIWKWPVSGIHSQCTTVYPDVFVGQTITARLTAYKSCFWNHQPVLSWLTHPNSLPVSGGMAVVALLSWLPSGNDSHSYGKWSCLIFTNEKWPFSIATLNYSLLRGYTPHGDS